ncbi:hypothetical protein Anapl_08749 [Anas platyrhynchos]|uniref:Uncharacterized protein n=1 Tax=Anas platyrhynchos TaxID=8839 RepID=R0JS54_ANAPL|nr:hypothetical protein Anapl_08749 [Anas platyrhynchos]
MMLCSRTAPENWQPMAVSAFWHTRVSFPVTAFATALEFTMRGLRPKCDRPFWSLHIPVTNNCSVITHTLSSTNTPFDCECQKQCCSYLLSFLESGRAEVKKKTKVDLHDLRQRATAARNPKPNVATKRHTSPLLRVQTELADDGLPPPSSLVYHEFGCDINFKVFRITLSKPPAWRDKAPPQKRSSSGQCPAVAEPGIAAGSRSFDVLKTEQQRDGTELICSGSVSFCSPAVKLKARRESGTLQPLPCYPPYHRPSLVQSRENKF